jgi:hypothetical protein
MGFMAIWAWLLLGVAVAGADVSTYPFVGVRHTHRAEAGLHVVEIHLDAPGLRFQLTQPGGGRETVRRTTVDFCRELAAQVCVNAHFFEPFPSAEMEAFLIGLAAAEGRRFSEFEKPRQSYALVENSPGVHVSATNEASLVGPGFGGRLWTVVAGSAQVVTAGKVTIPVYRDAAHPEGLLTPEGKYGNGSSWYDVATSRTLIGLTEDRRRVVLATVERSTVGAVATVLARDFGVWDAVNLDGGGSTTLVVDGAMVQGPKSGTARAVASSLAVFARRP